ncbi:unnamed protein product [Allacma fusca]|uniref:Uncharacterized protein n=1 Tax=Allacma fusca TaxID=39272 RepID=A0A8J2JPG6_9HEXA|nr:unnamed protein product [Allacma fusca]
MSLTKTLLVCQVYWFILIQSTNMARGRFCNVIAGASGRRTSGSVFFIFSVATVISIASAIPSSSKDILDKVELVNPLQLDQVLGITPYESIAKLVIAVNLPNPGLTSEGQDVVESSLNAIRTEFGSSLVPRFHQRFPPHSILAKTSNFAFGTEDQMRTYINILNQSDSRGFSLTVLNSSSFETLMNSKLGEIQSDLRYEDNSILTPLTIQKYKTVLQDYLRSSLISCYNRTLPQDLIGNFVQDKLKEIYDQDLLPNGYKFAIPPGDDFDLYLNQSLADCLFTTRRVYVMVNVPVVREQAKWKLYRAHHPKFVFDDKICTAGPDQDKFYAFDSDHEQVLELDPTLKTTCKMDGFNQLCLMPSLPSQKVSSRRSKNGKVQTRDLEMDPGHLVSRTCAAGILNKLPLNELKEECGFVCQEVTPDEYFFKEMTPHTVFLTNTKKARIFCPRNNLTRGFERIGTVKVELHSCDCYLWADEEFDSFQSCLDGKKSPSGAGSLEDFTISYLIPLTWTKNSAKSMVMEDTISFRIKNYKEIIDFEWLKKMTGDEKEDQLSFGAKYWNFFDDEYRD